MYKNFYELKDNIIFYKDNEKTSVFFILLNKENVVFPQNIILINLGEDLSIRIKCDLYKKYFQTNIINMINNLVNEKTNFIDGNNIIFMHNIGILFEPELKLSAESLFKNFSKENLIIIFWDGFYQESEKKLYFINSESGITMDLNNLKAKIINIKDKV
jgi:hypothetical protein